MNKKFLYFLTIFFFVSNNAYAYLDPGTGSLIIQSLIGIIAACMAAVGFYWTKVITVFKKVFKIKGPDNHKLD